MKLHFLKASWAWLQTKEGILLTAIIPLAGILRFYNLEMGMHYMGDEGRDALIASEIITGKHFPLIGPPTSVGNLYLGPLYFYLMAPFLGLFGFNPLGPAVFVAVLSLLTIVLIYILGKEIFSSWLAGIVAAFLYAISPLTVEFGRWPWNPNVMPFFAMVFIFSLWRLVEKREPKWWVIIGVSLAFMLQSHYLGLAAFPVLATVLFFKRPALQEKKYWLAGLFLFLLLMSPLLIFDLRHGFVNLKGVMKLIGERGQGGFSPLDPLTRSFDRIRQLFGEFTGLGERSWPNNIILVGILLAWWRFIKARRQWWLVLSWFLAGVLFLGFYQGSFYRHYLEFLLPLPSLIIGGLFASFWPKRSWRWLAVGTLAFLTAVFLPLTYKVVSKKIVPNVESTREIVSFISEKSEGKSFNFALLAENNYDSAYRYFFSVWQMRAEYNTVTEQLFVVCEGKSRCQPEGNPKWEIAVFDAAYGGKIKIVGNWLFYDYIRVFQFKPQKESL